MSQVLLVFPANKPAPNPNAPSRLNSAGTFRIQEVEDHEYNKLKSSLASNVDVFTKEDRKNSSKIKLLRDRGFGTYV